MSESGLVAVVTRIILLPFASQVNYFLQLEVFLLFLQGFLDVYTDIQREGINSSMIFSSL